ncbi:double-strand break repair protein MRE11 [Nematocida minor]|uniref:double-strand break repair protein MRE11 n=1 Tax=Nematocida minor TaxID=1912983 RepID=UPI0022202C65|nr:double-strand break repair protein MRE11 [Nematocida minor]KAI5189615.1 double-strand break repair protein MRE11 [Nematocida minor]
MRVLVTTDNHLGFLERDHIRGEDSFRAFEEVFKHAREVRADCILICGDLFHEVSPSKYTIYRTMEILQRNILGDKPIQIECTDNENFVDIQKRTRQVNYYSQNINIEMPVFAINGNHDEPSGHKGVTTLDIFAEAGLINYFGALEGKKSAIRVRPIILRKKNVVLNLYGMGGIRDEAMTKLLAEERLTFESAGKGSKVLVLHQTRCGMGGSSYVPEELLSKEMDLVIWGHMHQSEPTPVENYKMGFHTIQPGSTVQTSLCRAESGYKHCVLLKVTEEGWHTTPIQMKSPRSLIFRKISAQNSNIEEKIRTEMQSILEKCQDEHRPLVRLRVEVDESIVNTVIPKRTMEEFKDRVANPKEALRIIHKKKQVPANKKEALKNIYKNAQFTVELEDTRVLSKNVFMQSIMECVERENKAVISQKYDEIVQEVVKVLKSHRWTDIEKEIQPAVHEIEKRLTYSYSTAQTRGHSPAGTNLPIKEDSLRKREEDISFADRASIPPQERLNLHESAKTKDLCAEASSAMRDISFEEAEEQLNKDGSYCYISKEASNDVYRAIEKEKSGYQEENKNSADSGNSAKRVKTDYTFSSLWD